MGEQILSHLLTVPVSARVASEFQKPAIKAEQGLVVAFSQSGETSDTLTVLRRIKGQVYASLGVTNVMGSSITRAHRRLRRRDDSAGPPGHRSETGVSVAKLIRRLLEAFVAQYRSSKPPLTIVGIGRSGRHDVAERSEDLLRRSASTKEGLGH